MAGYVDEARCLPGRRSYCLAALASWEGRTRILLWPSDLMCPSWSVTAMLKQRDNRDPTYAERHALFIRIIGVWRTHFGKTSQCRGEMKTELPRMAGPRGIIGPVMRKLIVVDWQLAYPVPTWRLFVLSCCTVPGCAAAEGMALLVL